MTQLSLIQDQLTSVSLDLDSIFHALQKVKTADKHSDAMLSVAGIAISALNANIDEIADDIDRIRGSKVTA